MTSSHKSNDPGRDLVDLFHDMGRKASRQVNPGLETGEVLALSDPVNGLVVHLDNLTSPSTDCLQLVHVTGVAVGDRVLCLHHRGEVFVIGKMPAT